MPPRPLQARPVDTVVVYSSQIPEHPYKEIGILRAQAIMRGQDTTMVITALHEHAAKVGCDALLIHGTADRVVGGYSSSNDSTANHNEVTGKTTLETKSSGRGYVTSLPGFWGACILWEVYEGRTAKNMRRTGARPLRQQVLRQIKRRVKVELLREGVSIEKLNLAISLRKANTRGVTVALIDRNRNRTVRSKQIGRLPASQEARVAHLVVIIRSLIDSMNSGQ